MGALDKPRKVTVYGAKWPGDEEYDQSLKYFRKYVKPILVAAAVDYEMVGGKKHGDIANRVAEGIRLRRRFDLGLDPESEVTKHLPTYQSPAQVRKRELDGGIVIIGRPTFKEFMAGLTRGWTDGLEKVDQDEVLAKILEDDHHFDEPEDPEEMREAALPVQPKVAHMSPAFAPIHSSPRSQVSVPKDMDAPPAVVPLLPPLLLVPFTNYIGISQIPLMIWDFFNQRHKVRSGSEAGYTLVTKNIRRIEVSPPKQEPLFAEVVSAGIPPLDLDFDKGAESYYKNSLDSIPAEIEKSRQKYYEGLAPKLATARELARGTREPTKEEIENPPPTEVELRAERVKKERRWRDDAVGWDIVKPSTSVAWDPRFTEALWIFTPPQTERSLDLDLKSKT